MKKQLLEESMQDLREDFEELLYLFSSSLKQLQTFQNDIKKQKQYILSFETLLKATKQYEKEYEKIIKELEVLRNEMPDLVRHDKMGLPRHFVPRNDRIEHNFAKKETVLITLSEKKERYFDLYRSLQSIIAGLFTSTDWQSPTFNYSLRSLAGRQTGKILGNYNDYKRDQHLDAKIYAEMFRKEYVDTLFKFTIPIYMTNSGMAALTTILNFLQMEKKITGPILLGASSYFQNKELIKKIFSNVTEIHEHKTEKIIDYIKKENPSLLFFDSLCNSHDIAIPDIKEIMKAVKEILLRQLADQNDIYIVIDNTCLGASFQPLQLLGKFSSNIHMIVFESMNKYYQFGMDRTMGGVIYAWGRDMNHLFFARQHSGTIISDINCYLLPTPNRKLLEKRLKRHERNATILINALTNFLKDNPKHPIQDIVYPALSNHPAYDWSKKLSFHGSYFTFAWKPGYEKIGIYKNFIGHVLIQAKKANVQIVEGASFGMNTSRIYLTASNTKFGKPFVRFSLGTETRTEIEKIKEVLIAALEKL